MIVDISKLSIALDAFQSAVNFQATCERGSLITRAIDTNQRRDAVIQMFIDLSLEKEKAALLVNKVEISVSDRECIETCLDAQEIPKGDAQGKTYSIWERLCQYISKDKTPYSD